jgi:hypothetical protein
VVATGGTEQSGTQFTIESKPTSLMRERLEHAEAEEQDILAQLDQLASKR